MRTFFRHLCWLYVDLFSMRESVCGLEGVEGRELESVATG